MKSSRRSCACLLIATFTLFNPQTNALHAQTSPSQGSSSSGLLGQLSTAFAGGQVVQGVQLSGSATLYAGSLEDSGTLSLTATTSGSSQMQLSLGITGQRNETKTGAGSSSDCQWAGTDGVLHEVQVENCWKPVLWFLPALSLQPSLLPSYVATVDLGSGTVGFGPSAYRHLQSQLDFSDVSTSIAAQVMRRSITDIGLDPTTLLPAVLSYSVYPDSGEPTPMSIEIHYSDYRAVNGVQLPFHVQRYVNGSLQLDIVVSSAATN